MPQHGAPACGAAGLALPIPAAFIIATIDIVNVAVDAVIPRFITGTIGPFSAAETGFSKPGGINGLGIIFFGQ
jgi:hypothetical protein